MADHGDRRSAEIVPTDRADANRVARSLQQLGFRVLRVGDTVSVDAPEERWSQVLGVGSGPDPSSVRLPPELDGLVADVLFVPPPEFF